MTTQISSDDECMVCGETRENHGDKHHKFSIDGTLVPLKPEVPKALPPTERGKALARDPLTNMSLRLIERLVAKDLLNGDDMLYIFGGESDVPDRGAAGNGATGTDNPKPAE